MPRPTITRPIDVPGLLVRRRRTAFALGFVALAAAVVYLFGFDPLTYNRSMEGFFPRSDPRLQLYQKNKEWFGGEGTLLVAYTDPRLWTEVGMRTQRDLVLQLRRLQHLGVKSVNSVMTSPLPADPSRTVGEAIEAADGDSAAIADIQNQVRSCRLYDGVFVAGDMKTTALVVQLQPVFASSDDVARCLNAVRDRSRQHLTAARDDLEGPAVAGTLLMIHDVYERTEGDGRRLQVASVLLMGLVIAAFFRSLRWILLPFVIIYAALFWSESAWGLIRGELTMVSSAISSLVTVVGVVTVVHFGMHYRELRHDRSPVDALRQTLADLGRPVFWMLLTTAAGFGALLVCELKPVLDFAWLMVIAILLIGVATAAFLPMTVLGLRGRETLAVSGRDFLSALLGGLLGVVQRRPWISAAVLIVPGVVIGLGVFRLEAQTDFTRNFRQRTEIFQAYDFIETRLGGAGQLDLVWNCPDLLAMDEAGLNAYVERLDRLEQALAELTDDSGPVPGVTKVLGIADFLDFFDTALNGLQGPLARAAKRSFPPSMRLKILIGDVEEARDKTAQMRRLLGGLAGRLLPPVQRQKLQRQLDNVDRQLEQFQTDRPGRHFWNRTAGKMRVTLQVKERLSSREKDRLIAAAVATARRVLGPDSQPRATGIYVMLTHLIESVLDDQKATFGVAVVCMFAMAAVAFRSLRLAAVAMIPTVLPVVAIVGTMGWIGLRVNIATAMLASVAMGMAIDSSILYIYRFVHERRSGADFHQALARTHRNTGLALIVSNVALVLGFAVLVLSDFVPLVHFGILTGLALLGGLIGNLVLLPLLLGLVISARGPSTAPTATSLAAPAEPTR